MGRNFPEFNNEPFVVVTGVQNVTQFFQIVGKRGYTWGRENASRFTQGSLSAGMNNLGENLAFIIEDTDPGWDRRQYFEEEYHYPVYTFDEFLEKIGQYKNESEGLNDHQIDQFSILL